MDYESCFDSPQAKCKRVQSWYMYEQYKSLEKNQLDATQRLKKKSYQDKILRQELSERRARRRLCDEFGLSQSESRLDRSVGSIPSNVLLHDEALFQSFCELRDEYELESYEDHNSNDSNISKEFDYKSTDIGNSIVNDDIKGELETVKNNIAENISLQLGTVKDNIECLEKYSTLKDDDVVPDVDTAVSNGSLKFDVKLKKDDENNVVRMWTKLVDFAYKIINLNHGNCYYDYSSQLLTAVLACDILLRGISRMCNILQPYVSPIKYATSDSETSLLSNKKTKRKKSVNYENYKTNNTIKYNLGNKYKHKKLQGFGKKYRSENDWHNCCNIFENYPNELKYRGASEPLRSTSRFTDRKSSSKSYRKYPEHICKCSIKKGVDPIVQLARYIDNLLQDIEELNNFL